MNNLSSSPPVFPRIERMHAYLLNLIALCFVFGVPVAQSQTLDWGSLSGSTIVNSTGSPLDNTYLFQLGTFDVGFTPTVTNHGQWPAKWHVFDTAAYSYDPLAGAYFTGSQNIQEVPAYGTLFEGLKAYLWIHDASDTQNLLASASTWTFPVQDPSCCPTGAVTDWSVSNFGTSAPIMGGQDGHDGGGIFNSSAGPYDLQTAVVPEPASSLLALFASGMLLLRRRRLKL